MKVTKLTNGVRIRCNDGEFEALRKMTATGLGHPEIKKIREDLSPVGKRGLTVLQNTNGIPDAQPRPAGTAED